VRKTHSVVVRGVRCAGVVVLAALTACGHGHAKPAPPTIALVLASPARGYRSANAQAHRGLLECGRASGAHIAVSAGDDAERQVTLYATEDVDTIVGIGPIAASAIAQAARRFESRHFVSIGAIVPQPNVESIVFDVRGAAYLAGALAAAASKTGRVAIISAEPIDPLRRMGAAFESGAASVRRHATVRTAYLRTLDDRTAAARAAERLFDDRVDVIYFAAGTAGLGVADAARRRAGVSLINDQSDQYGLPPGKVLASVMYRVDVAALRACLETVAQKPSSGVVVLGVKQGAVTLSGLANAGSVVGPQAAQRVEAVARALGAAHVTGSR
jgi:basic membrane protein A